MGRFDFTFSHTFCAQASDSVVEGMSSLYQVIDRLIDRSPELSLLNKAFSCFTECRRVSSHVFYILARALRDSAPNLLFSGRGDNLSLIGNYFILCRFQF